MTRSPRKRAKYCTECKDILCSYEVDKKSPLPPHECPVWALSLLSAALYYVDRISPNCPPSHHAWASGRTLAEESSWQKNCGLFR